MKVCVISISKLRFLFFVLFLILCSTNIFAFQFSPLEQEFEAFGVNAQKTYTIINDSDEDIAIKLSIVTRDQSETEEEIRGESSNEFVITPSRVIVRAQSSYVVHVRYRGLSTVAIEKPYRLIVEQISYNDGKKTSNNSMFTFLYVYVTSLYVKPSKIMESVVVSKITATLDEYGNKEMQIWVQNNGNVHQILSNVKLTITDFKGNFVSLEGSGILGDLEALNLLARKAVKITIPWPSELEFSLDKEYSGSLSFSN